MKKMLFIIAFLAVPMLASDAAAQQDYTYDWSLDIAVADTVGGGVKHRDTVTSYVWDQNKYAYRKYLRTIQVTGVDSTVADTIYVVWYHGITKDGPWTRHDSTKVIPRVKTDTVVNMANVISTDSLIYKGNFWKVVVVNAFTPKQADWAYYVGQGNELAHKIEIFWYGKY